MIDEELRRDIPALARFVADEHIERLYLPYAAFQPLVECILHADLQAKLQIQDVIVAGEQLQVSPPIRQLFSQLPEARLHNQYGPSETHVVTAYTLQAGVDEWPTLPPIGRPVANTTAYVLDAELRPMPVGVPGELCIGGAQVGLGYLYRDEQTAEKFIADPFGSADARLYRTGDRVRYLADGVLEYLGRVDDQVKWRGFRIEPGEIEALLTAHATVQLATVLLREDTPDDKRLVAYLVPADGEAVVETDIRAHIKGSLPDYMVPSIFITLDAMPLTPSGKVARRMLPAPDGSRNLAEGGEMPVEHDQVMLAKVWGSLLKVDQVMLDDNFFDMGGHSLLTIKLIQALEAATDQQFTIADVFDNPTIREFSQLLDNVTWKQLDIGKANILVRLWRYLVGRRSSAD
jgi:acyl-coenzyme A synthetase/AMP-(fatty) acid ligase